MSAIADTPPKRRRGNPPLQVRIPAAELELLRARAAAAGYPDLSSATRDLLRRELLAPVLDADAPTGRQRRRKRR